MRLFHQSLCGAGSLQGWQGKSIPASPGFLWPEGLGVCAELWCENCKFLPKFIMQMWNCSSGEIMRRLGWFWAPAQPLLQALPGLSSSASSRWPLIQWHCKTWIDNNSLLADGRESGLVQIRAGSRQFFFMQEFLIWRCRTAQAALPSYLYDSTKKKICVSWVSLKA